MEQSEEQYVRWLRQAAENGSGAAQCNLAMCYQEGTGVEQNEEQFLHWLCRARMNQSVNARAELWKYDED